MENLKKISSVPKKSFIKKVIGFTRSDEDYDAAILLEEKTKVSVPVKKFSLGVKNIKAALIVISVFYILLCVFILLNPQFSLFFNNIFGIEYVTIRFILEYTIYVFYSIFGIFLGGIFLFFGYRSLAIRTRKKLKQTALWFLTVIFGGLFFGNVALFAWTYTWFLTIDFTNIQERVLIYDNTLLGYKPKLSDPTRFGYPKKTSATDLSFFKVPKKAIGPLTVRYDISPQIKKVVRENGILLSRGYSFSIDYNRDSEPDTGSGDNVGIELPITNANAEVLVPGKFEEAGQYKTIAILRGVDAAGEAKEVTIEMPDILIQNIVKVSDKVTQDGSRVYIFDAASLSNLGQAHWSILGDPSSAYVGYQYSPKNIIEYPAIVCLKMQPMDVGATDPCDWRYVIGDNIQTNITETAIQIRVDPLDPLKYEFSVEPKLGQGELKTIRWKIDGKLYTGKFPSGTEKIFDYTFKTSGTYLVEADIEDTLGNTVNTSTDPIFTTLFTQLKSGYSLRVMDESGIDISKNTYNTTLKTYYLPDIAVPSVLTLDAIGIQSVNPRLKLSKVEWDMDSDGLYEKNDFKISHEIPLPEQYTFYARYTFEDKTIDGEKKSEIFIDKIVIKGIEKAIDVRVKIRPDRDYAPALVYFDATGSRVRQGEIVKFLYDFGDGSKVFEGEGIVEYRYKVPGEYKVKVTAVIDDGRRATSERVLIIKKPQESIVITPSVASENAQAGFPITFDIISQGTVESVQWNFGDGTGMQEGRTIIHTFRTSGVYTVIARALYESGIEKSETITYQVK